MGRFDSVYEVGVGTLAIDEQQDALNNLKNEKNRKLDIEDHNGHKPPILPHGSGAETAEGYFSLRLKKYLLGQQARVDDVRVVLGQNTSGKCGC